MTYLLIYGRPLVRLSPNTTAASLWLCRLSAAFCVKKGTKMKIHSTIMALIMVISVSGCARANVSKSREAYILSQPHGWIKITVTDENVPSDLPPKDLPADKKEHLEPKPPSCSFIVKLNNERFLYESIFPFGNEPPYIVDTGFRFPAPVGNFEIIIQYQGCDIENEEMTTLSFSYAISVDENMVTPISFDGESFSIGDIEENSVITLEDIYQEIKQINEK